MTAVNSGLSAGERVVVDGADRLRDGLHVNVATPRRQAGRAGDRAELRRQAIRRPAGGKRRNPGIGQATPVAAQAAQ